MELLNDMYNKVITESNIGSNQLKDLLENKCYIALKEIKEIISNDDLSESECFMQIEEIVRVFESLGSNGGGRHDFG